MDQLDGEEILVWDVSPPNGHTLPLVISERNGRTGDFIFETSDIWKSNDIKLSWKNAMKLDRPLVGLKLQSMIDAVRLAIHKTIHSAKKSVDEYRYKKKKEKKSPHASIMPVQGS